MKIRLTKNVEIERGEQIPLDGFPRLHDGLTILRPGSWLSASYKLLHLASEDQSWSYMLTLCGKDNYVPVYSLHGMILPSGKGVEHTICDACIAIACKIQNLAPMKKSRKIIDL